MIELAITDIHIVAGVMALVGITFAIGGLKGDLFLSGIGLALATVSIATNLWAFSL